MATKTKSEEPLPPRILFFWTVSRNGYRILGIREELSQKGTSRLGHPAILRVQFIAAYYSQQRKGPGLVDLVCLVSFAIVHAVRSEIIRMPG